jgi:hypothetical protein
METKESKKQQYEKYISEHDIEKTITEMLNSLVHEKSTEPLVFMIKYLTGMLTDEQKTKNNINIPGPYPNNIPLVKFPDLENNYSILKNHITRRIWQHIKYNKSKNGANIMDVLKLADEKIGVLLADGDCIRVFGLVLEPMLRALNPEFDHEANENGFQEVFGKIKSNMRRISVSYSRNLRDVNFISSMSKPMLEQVEDAVRQSIDQLEGEKLLRSGRLLSLKENEVEIRNRLMQVIDYDNLIYELNKLGLMRGKWIFLIFRVAGA